MESRHPPRTAVRSERKRNARTVLSLQQFAHSKSKGTRRAIETYRQKRENKFNHRAGLVRSYRKALKTEGFEPRTRKNEESTTNNNGGAGSGNRKRCIETTDLEEYGSDDDVINGDDDVNKKTTEVKISSNKVSHHRKRQKFDPFAKARLKAIKNKEMKTQRQEDIRTQLEVKERKLIERKKRSKVMSKRTRRGQPIMKNVIGAMLGKLQEEASH